MNGPEAICGTQVIECPRCAGRFMFLRSRHPLIDSCGFESYGLVCKECGIGLAGIIDPSDDKLLLSENVGEVQHEAVSLPHNRPQAPAVRERSFS